MQFQQGGAVVPNATSGKLRILSFFKEGQEGLLKHYHLSVKIGLN